MNQPLVFISCVSPKFRQTPGRANRESVRGYAEAYRNGERISTAHVECTVNQLINWRMCKKQQMGWSRAGAQYLLHVKTAIINGRLERYTGNHSIPADIAA